MQNKIYARLLFYLLYHTECLTILINQVSAKRKSIQNPIKPYQLYQLLLVYFLCQI